MILTIMRTGLDCKTASAERSRSLIRMLTEAFERGANFLEYFFQI
jgi:hypothetical protein